MANEAVNYHLYDGVATLRIDDGKSNVMSPSTLREIYAALDRAESDKAIVVITGRESVFSAGFDLNVMKGKPSEALKMLKLGYSLTARIMSHPYPVIAACNGHSLAMGVFLMLSCDYIIGTRGEFRIAANEVAIGMTMPRVAAITMENRLTPAAYQTAIALARYFSTDEALQAGFFDELVDADDMQAAIEKHVDRFKKLSPHAHTVSKRRMRKSTVRKIRRSVPLDLLDAAMLGLRGGRPK